MDLCRTLATLSLAVAAGPVAAAAQVVATVEGGATRIEYDNDIGVSVFALSPFVQWNRSLSSLTALGTFSRFDDGTSGVYGALTGSLFTPEVAGLRMEFSGSLDGSAQEGASGSHQLGALARLHWMGASQGVWLGGGVGSAWDGVTARGTASGELGAWGRIGGATLVGALRPSRIGEEIRFVDAEAMVRISHGRTEISAFGGLRHWSRPADAAGTSWAGVSGTYWLGDHIALAGSIGSYPADFAQGYPAGRYGTLTLRWASRRPDLSEPTLQPSYRLLPPVVRPLVPEFELRPAGNGRHTIRVLAPGAARVEIMGDFTDWQPVVLRNLGAGRWDVTLAIPPGLHRFNLRVDSGPWGVPPGVTAVSDDFNGVVGILPVE